MKKSPILNSVEDLQKFLFDHREITHDFMDQDENLDWSRRNLNAVLLENPFIHFPCIATLYVNSDFGDGIACVGIVYPEDFN